MPPKESKITLNPITVGVFLLISATLVLIAVSLAQLFRQNPYGPETKIDNIDVVTPKLPQEQQDQIFAQLYNVIKYNLDNVEPPKSGALIREDTVDYGYDKKTGVYSGSFIVDVAAVEQSLLVQLDWSPNPNNEYIGGYPVLITCAPKNLRIYSDQKGCVDSLTKELSWANIYQIDYTFGATTSQKIQGALNDVLIGDNEDLDGLLATIDEISLTKLSNQPDITYQYDVILNKKRYQITTRVDTDYGREYIIIYVNSESKKQGIILTDLDDQVDEFSAWLKSFSNVSNLEITLKSVESFE